MSRYRLILIVSGALVFSLLISPGAGEQISGGSPENELDQAGFVLPQKHESRLTLAEQRGQALYEYYCALCHGKTGHADGFNSYSLATTPAKHADASLMATVSDTQIQRIIKEGGAVMGLSPQMPPWGGVFTDEQIADLTTYIRTLAKRPVGTE
jgi:mono/diheme cytochrome c family protein